MKTHAPGKQAQLEVLEKVRKELGIAQKSNNIGEVHQASARANGLVASLIDSLTELRPSPAHLERARDWRE